MSVGWSVTRPRLVLLFVLLVGVVVGSAVFNHLAGSGHSVFWPTVGVGFVILTTAQRGSLRTLTPLYGVAVFVGLLLRGKAFHTAFLFGAANMIEVWVAAVLYLRMTHHQVILRGAAGLVKLVVASMVGAAVMAGLAGVIYGLPTGPSHASGFVSSSAIAIFFGHLSGLSMVVPVCLVERHRSIPRAMWLEAAGQVVIFGVILALVFSPGSRPLGFAPFAPLAWAAVRFTPALAAVELLITSIVVTVTTLRGWGLFAEFGRDVGDRVTGSELAVVYELTLLGTILSLALTVSRVRLSGESLIASEDLYRRTFDEAMLGMLMLERTLESGKESRIVRANPVATRFLTTDGQDLVGTGLLDHLAEEDCAIVGEALTAVFQGKQDTCHSRVQFATGSSDERHVSMTLSPLRDGLGSVTRVAIQMADITDAHLATQRLADLALHDPLTGLANRTLFEDRLSNWLEMSGRDCKQVLLLYIDLDDFKLVNDSSGHETGDKLLLEVSRRLIEILRPHDTVARLGGDEFVVIAPEMPADAEDASDIVSSRLLAALSAPYRIDGQTYSVGASVGMALSRADSTPTSLMREADSAMYEAKRQGKNCRHLYRKAEGQGSSERTRMLTQLNEAITKDQFELHIQPLIDLPTGAVVGGEALIRWRHPERGLLAPAAWLAVAEESDLVHRLGAWVIDEACRQAAAWENVLGPSSPIVHANVSARQLGHGTLLDDVRGALARTGLSPDKLVLELTETQLERPEAAVQADFDGLRAAGIQIAADDFGTGYSSLTRLTDMPIDILKIDRTFVARMSEDERARAVVAALVTMGSAIGMEVVAEGVETVDEATHLRDLGCGQGQGYLWSKPVPAEDFLDLAMHRVSVLEATPSLVTRPSKTEVLTSPRGSSAVLNLND